MVTLVQPLDGGTRALWRLVWSNVPEGVPVSADRTEEALPWLRRTRTSEGDKTVTPEMSHPAEAFFGMPRRLRLRLGESAVTGVVQKPHGARYTLWQHPLSPYYRQKPGAELLPVHPKTGQGQLPQLAWTCLREGERNAHRRSLGASVPCPLQPAAF